MGEESEKKKTGKKLSKRERAVEELIAMMKKGYKMGGLKYKHRGELYDRLDYMFKKKKQGKKKQLTN